MNFTELLAGLDNGQKSAASRAKWIRELNHIKDLLVRSHLQRALPVFLGENQTAADASRLERVLSRTVQVLVVDLDEPYRQQLQEVVRLSHGTVDPVSGAMSLPAKTRLFDANCRIAALVGIERWKSSSYYGNLQFLGGRLHQPKQLSSPGNSFGDVVQLVRLWKGMLRHEGVEGRQRVSFPDEYGCSNLKEVVRSVCGESRFVEQPVILMFGASSKEEVDNITKLFGRSPVFVEKVARKGKLVDQANTILNNIENQKEAN